MITDGESKFIKIYTAYNKEADDSVVISLNFQELKDIVNNLKDFADEISQFKMKNKDKKELGLTHLHFKDCGLFEKNSKSDLIFYVNLSE